MDFVKNALQFIPQAATHPFSLIAYLSVVAAWTAIQFRIKRNETLISNIEKLNPADRLAALESEMGTSAVRGGLSPEQWLKQKRQSYFMYGFLALLATAILVFTIAIREGQAARSRAELIGILNGRAESFLDNMDRMVAAIDQRLTASEGEYSNHLKDLRLGLTEIRDQVSALTSQQTLAMQNNELIRFYELGNQLNAFAGRFQPLIEKSKKYTRHIERLQSRLPPGITSADQSDALLEEKHQIEQMIATAREMSSMMTPR